MAKPKKPPKKKVKARFEDGKLEPFPNRGRPRQNIRKQSGSGKAPKDVTACARKVANYRYRKDIDYKKYLLEKGKARVAKEKAEKQKKAQSAKAKEAEKSKKLILKYPKSMLKNKK